MPGEDGTRDDHAAAPWRGGGDIAQRRDVVIEAVSSDWGRWPAGVAVLDLERVRLDRLRLRAWALGLDVVTRGRAGYQVHSHDRRRYLMPPGRALGPPWLTLLEVEAVIARCEAKIRPT